MNLRPKAMLLALLTALIAVLGDWSGNSWLSTLWRLPAGVLLLGLAYESLVMRRAGVSIDISAGVQLWAHENNTVRLQGDLRNVTNQFNVINFAGLFSGTALASPRSFGARLQIGF